MHADRNTGSAWCSLLSAGGADRLLCSPVMLETQPGGATWQYGLMCCSALGTSAAAPELTTQLWREPLTTTASVPHPHS